MFTPGLGLTLRTAAFGLLGFHLVQIGAYASMLSAQLALQGQPAALAPLPVAVAAFGLAALAVRELADGLRAAR